MISKLRHHERSDALHECELRHRYRSFPTKVRFEVHTNGSNESTHHDDNHIDRDSSTHLPVSPEIRDWMVLLRSAQGVRQKIITDKLIQHGITPSAKDSNSPGFFGCAGHIRLLTDIAMMR
jgi:hypothetical protein